MSRLASALRRRPRHALVRPGEPAPAGTPDLYLWAGNGVFKRGTNAALDLLIQLAVTPPIPGLAPLRPGVRWHGYLGERLPEWLLDQALAAARAATCGSAGAAQLIEWQGHIVARAGRPVLVSPPPLAASATRVRYTLPDEPVLVDLHSHHRLAPFFSATDDADDAGLSVSVVLGHIETDPTLLCRLNVYDQRQLVPAQLVFDNPGPFRDGFADHLAAAVISDQPAGWPATGREVAALAALAARLAGVGPTGEEEEEEEEEKQEEEGRCDHW